MEGCRCGANLLSMMLLDVDVIRYLSCGSMVSISMWRKNLAAMISCYLFLALLNSFIEKLTTFCASICGSEEGRGRRNNGSEKGSITQEARERGKEEEEGRRGIFSSWYFAFTHTLIVDMISIDGVCDNDGAFFSLRTSYARLEEELGVSSGERDSSNRYSRNTSLSRC